jgi:tRNA (cmo5U34)-methyltransferase
MITPLEQKSSTDEIKARFDNDVERFSNLDTGQTATIDAPLAMELSVGHRLRSRQQYDKTFSVCLAL